MSSRRSPPVVRRRTARDGGYSVVEAAITLPVMLVLIMLVIQYALLWHGRHVAEAAARDGLRAARAWEATPAAARREASDYLRQVAPNLLRNRAVVVTATATDVRVEVRADVLPLLSFGSFPVHEAASGPRERFTAGG